jgi:hypothetical protein
VIILTAAGCHTPTGSVCTYHCGPIPASGTGGRYAALPSVGLVDTLPMKTRVDVVGYGVQNSHTYSYRVDTAEALQWIRSTVAARGGALS